MTKTTQHPNQTKTTFFCPSWRPREANHAGQPQNKANPATQARRDCIPLSVQCSVRIPHPVASSALLGSLSLRGSWGGENRPHPANVQRCTPHIRRNKLLVLTDRLIFKWYNSRAGRSLRSKQSKNTKATEIPSVPPLAWPYSPPAASAKSGLAPGVTAGQKPEGKTLTAGSSQQ